MNRLAMGLAVGAGYVLGRTKKAKFAFAVGTMVAGKRLNLSPKALGSLVTQQLDNNPQFKEIGDQLRQDLRGVGKAATGSLLNRQLEGLADRLHDRTLGVQDRIAGVVPDDVKGTDRDEDDEDPEADDAEDGAKRPAARKSGSRAGSKTDEESAPKSAAKKTAATAKKAPAKRTARKTAQNKTAQNKTAQSKSAQSKSAQSKSTQSKTAQKKTTSAARRTASGGRAKGGDRG